MFLFLPAKHSQKSSNISKNVSRNSGLMKVITKKFTCIKAGSYLYVTGVENHRKYICKSLSYTKLAVFQDSGEVA